MENGRDYAVGDLDPRSWPAFEELFKKYNGVQNSCWCVYYHKDTRKGFEIVSDFGRSNVLVRKIVDPISK